MRTELRGKVYVIGNNIDTDAIIPARYLNTMDPAVLGKHAMEDLDPRKYPIPFLSKDGTCSYGVVIAGKNFGCGSSREHAPIALHAAGIDAVIAGSFARIFYRNAVNGGIVLPLESTLDLSESFRTGDEAKIELSGSPVISNESHNERGGRAYPLMQFGPVAEIIEAGGLTAYNKKRLGMIK